MIRSSVVPQTIASETAQKTNWKKNFGAGSGAAENDSAGKLRCRPQEEAVECRALAAVPKASAKPHRPEASGAIEKLARIFATTLPAFFLREKPTSSIRSRPA